MKRVGARIYSTRIENIARVEDGMIDCGTFSEFDVFQTRKTYENLELEY